MFVLIPAYQPGRALVTLATRLRDDGTGVVVVDDGSSPGAASLFEAVEEQGCTLLRHPANRGKGAALRTGFRHLLDANTEEAIVCADADGQHSVADIRKVGHEVEVAHRIVLGARAFTGRVPFRSRLGNTVTRYLYQRATGYPVTDTQTGLRGYPATLLPWLLEIPGDGFEYEMRLLIEAARTGKPIAETSVATTYLDGNASSHFGSLRDSYRVYRPLLRALLLPKDHR